MIGYTSVIPPPPPHVHPKPDLKRAWQQARATIEDRPTESSDLSL